MATPEQEIVPKGIFRTRSEQNTFAVDCPETNTYDGRRAMTEEIGKLER